MVRELAMYVEHRLNTFKDIFTTLKDIITDANLEFNFDGLRIFEVDVERVSIIEVLLLNLDNYTFYYNEPINIGISIAYIQKILKGNKPDALVCMKVYNDDIKTLEIDIKSANSNTTLKLPSMIIPKCAVCVPNVDWDWVCESDFKTFAVMIKELSHTDKISRFLILQNSAYINVNANGPFGIHSLVFTPTFLNRANNEEYDQQYLTKYIERFFKYELNNNVMIKMKQGHPIVFEMAIPFVGNIKYVVASIE